MHCACGCCWIPQSVRLYVLFRRWVFDMRARSLQPIHQQITAGAQCAHSNPKWLTFTSPFTLVFIFDDTVSGGLYHTIVSLLCALCSTPPYYDYKAQWNAAAGRRTLFIIQPSFIPTLTYTLVFCALLLLLSHFSHFEYFFFVFISRFLGAKKHWHSAHTHIDHCDKYKHNFFRFFFFSLMEKRMRENENAFGLFGCLL